MPILPPPFSHTAVAMDRAIVAAAKGGDNLGVPMSAAVNPCERATWYALRWAAPQEAPDGARQRRFRTGKAYERWLLDDLRSTGCDVREIDETTGKQFRVELAAGWLRGKVDGLAVGVVEAPRTEHIVECKSHNERSFKDLVKKGLREGKPDHFAQVQLSMHGLGLTRALYLAANKNTDEIHAERVDYDLAYCFTLETRIERIVRTERAPPRAHEDPDSKAAFACAWCPAKGICHEGQFARLNCRTCLYASLEDGPVVRCTKWERALSYADQQAGCPAHLYLPDLVPGEQLDADEVAGTVTYCLRDGSEWRDGAGQGRAA